MTVIALLNAESSPHIVADTLLTANGDDPRTDKTVWLPSVGAVSSSLSTKEKSSYIVRLARKTLFLPNESGVLAFSGDCIPVFRFWKELSEHILCIGGYQPKLRVDREMIERALKHSKGGDFSLLGLIGNAQKKWEVFTYGAHLVIETKNFGTCYLAGSGAPLLRDKLCQRDASERPSPPNVETRIDPTENLAEGISSELLYAESDSLKGLRDVAAYACGGFYEWYRVVDNGVGVPPARLDLHITEVNNTLLISRIYFSEPRQQNETQLNPFPGTIYYVSVTNIVLDPVAPIESDNGTWMVPAQDPYSTLIEPAFELYSSEGQDGRIAGFLTPEVLQDDYEHPVLLKRVRLICSGSRFSMARSISRRSDENEVLATLSYRAGRLEVSLSAPVVEIAKNMTLRLRQS